MKELCERFGDSNVLYGIFGIIILFFLVLDLGIVVRQKKEMTIRSAAIQTLCWVTIALGFGYLIYRYHGTEKGLQYISAYLMEYSLSADNLFVFIIILSYFKVSEQYYHKVLFYGILGAVIFRVIFILLGIVIVQKFDWMLYIFGLILVYTGVRMLMARDETEFKPEKNLMYKFLRRYLNFLDHEADGNFSVVKNGKRYFSILFLVIAIIASTDLVFALDSIPAVFAISQDRLVIITSNIFAVMGLRAMFFLLSHAANKFTYLQEGISVVLIFIGAKMLVEIFKVHIPTGWSLIVIATVLSVAVMISVLFEKKGKQ
ncbi:MAG TPA: TerC/Alx family metal homeostasis membrane protein [Chitinophagales bacterium]|nr:TerC/Alx family metal homeostasis membrane protein [Chitinophagales bacterium]